MSQVLTVPTHFNDIGELSDGFLDRVEHDTLILYGPVAYEDGSEIEFSVLLADGSVALGGVGRVRAAVDGGEARVPETRYDVVLEALELDGRSEVVFERLVIARQAVSDAPPDEEQAAAEDLDVSQEDDEPTVEAIEVEDDAEFSIPPDDEDEQATVIAAVDAEALMAQAVAADEDSEVNADTDAQADSDTDADTGTDAELEHETVSGGDFGYDVEQVAAQYAGEIEFKTELEPESESDIEVGSANESESRDETSIASGDENETGFRQDSMYAFEHGIASEPRVGMPVPIPSMAAPPEAPPAPPTLRLAEPPEGLTRPSFAPPDDPLFSVDGEVSDVHATGLFSYEDGLPIPSRPPLPDPNRAKQVARVEAANDYDVEDSEPLELLAEDYEEARLSDFAEAAEEG